jgi:alpha-tubulin suppressor-like RCC1 family protein
MLRLARRILGAASITLALLGCEDAAAPLRTINPVPVSFVTVEPPTANVPAGQTVQLTATTRDADQHLLTERVVTWASGSTAVATVSATGLVTGVAAGEATITATSEGRSGTAAITVPPAGPVADINGVWDWTEHIADPSNNAFCDDTGSYTFAQQATTVVGLSEQVGTCLGPGGPYRNDATDSVRAGVVASRSVSFRVARGTITCYYAGAFPSSSTDSLTGSVTCGAPTGTWRAVRGGGLGSVTVTPSSARVLAGARVQFRAEVRTLSGDRAFGRPVTWSTDNTAVATITPDGIAAALGSGTAAVTAAAGGKSGSAGLTVPPALALTAVAVGTVHTCALEASGGGYCWGLNDYGQLGNGSTNYSFTPVGVSGERTFAALTGGFYHTCGLDTGGAAYCWGQGDNGKLGNGSTADSAVPVPVVGGLRFTTVSAAGLHTCALSTSGAAYCWGWNGLGQLGDGSTTDRLAPVAVADGHTFVTLTAGGHHTCGVTAGGAAYCWGNNANGELGDGSGTTSVTPVLVGGGLSFAALSAGYYYTCGLTTDGAAYCWGWNGFGQLGDGSMTGSTTPVRVADGLTFASLGAGMFHTCGLTTEGAAYCWGRNDVGELGNGSTTSSLTPVAVAGGLKFLSVSAAGWRFYDEPEDLLTDHTCAITTNRVAYCWGSNAWGFLGDGSGAQSLVPIKVAGQL